MSCEERVNRVRAARVAVDVPTDHGLQPHGRRDPTSSGGMNMSNQPTEQFKCDRCGATSAKRTGTPFDEASLRAHRIRGCATVATTVEIGLSQTPTNGDSGKSIESLSSTIAT